MAADEIHIGDIGTELFITLRDGSTSIDVSAALVKQIILVDPHGIEHLRVAAFGTDGTDGVLKYTSVDGDFYAKGTWKFQVYVELPSGKWKSDIASFKVHSNLSGALSNDEGTAQAIAASLISADADNEIVLGADGKLFAAADSGGGGLSYLVYTARLSQSGTNAPVPHILENTLGFEPTWTRLGTGSYAVDLGDFFDSSKIWVTSVGINANDDFRAVQLLADSQESGTQFFFQCIRLDTGAAVELHTAASAPRCYIEIRFYP